jgi:putative transposase
MCLHKHSFLTRFRVYHFAMPKGLIRYQRAGDFNVYTEAKRVEKLRYMHRNPVTRGLVSQPDQWAWSSVRHWATGERGTIEIESHWTARRRGGLPVSLQYSPDTLQAHISNSRCGAPTSQETR